MLGSRQPGLHGVCTFMSNLTSTRSRTHHHKNAHRQHAPTQGHTTCTDSICDAAQLTLPNIHANSSRVTKALAPLIPVPSASAPVLMQSVTPEARAFTPSLKATPTSRLDTSNTTPEPAGAVASFRDANLSSECRSTAQTAIETPQLLREEPRRTLIYTPHPHGAHGCVLLTPASRKTEKDTKHVEKTVRFSASTVFDRASKHLPPAGPYTGLQEQDPEETDEREETLRKEYRGQADTKRTQSHRPIDAVAQRQDTATLRSSRGESAVLDSSELDSLREAFESSQRTIAGTRRQLRRALEALDHTEARLSRERARAFKHGAIASFTAPNGAKSATNNTNNGADSRLAHDKTVRSGASSRASTSSAAMKILHDAGASDGKAAAGRRAKTGKRAKRQRRLAAARATGGKQRTKRVTALFSVKLKQADHAEKRPRRNLLGELDANTHHGQQQQQEEHLQKPDKRSRAKRRRADESLDFDKPLTNLFHVI